MPGNKSAQISQIHTDKIRGIFKLNQKKENHFCDSLCLVAGTRLERATSGL